MTLRHAASLLILLAAVPLLSSCWDKTEMNQLALVSMVGVDSDPDKGTIKVYYQIINPLSGSSTIKAPGGEQAPVYTYEMEAKSFGEIRSQIYKKLPRKLFIAHYKVLLVSEQTARQSIRDYANFIEMQPNGRSSIPMLVVEGPLEPVMKTFTPLEKVPSDSIRARLDQLIQNSLLSERNIRITDVIERMQQSRSIVLPILTRIDDARSAKSGEVASNIDAEQGSFIISGGAVFQNYRMTGRLNDEQMIWYHLLAGDKGLHVRLFEVEGKPVSLEFHLNQIKRKASWQSGRPVIRIFMDIELSTAYASEYIPKSRNEVDKMEQEVSQAIERECYKLYELSREREWDLLGIKYLLRRKTPDHPNIEDAEKNAKVSIQVNARLKKMGSLQKPYDETGGGS